MTDEERQKLIAAIRGDNCYGDYAIYLAKRAAREIERLASLVEDWKSSFFSEHAENAHLRDENKVLWSALPEGITEVNPGLMRPKDKGKD
jgi:hypothetical protein